MKKRNKRIYEKAREITTNETILYTKRGKDF
jgi:hypothetical protein